MIKAFFELGFQFYMVEAKPGEPIGDKAYDGDDLNLFLAKEGIDLIPPSRSNRRPDRQTQDLANCAVIGADGSPYASSPGYNTSDDPRAMEFHPPSSLVSCSLLRSAFSFRF